MDAVYNIGACASVFCYNAIEVGERIHLLDLIVVDAEFAVIDCVNAERFYLCAVYL